MIQYILVIVHLCYSRLTKYEEENDKIEKWANYVVRQNHEICDIQLNNCWQDTKDGFDHNTKALDSFKAHLCMFY